MHTDTKPQYQAWIAHLQQAHDANRNSWGYSAHFQIRKPAWLKRGDDLNTFFKKKDDLVKRGLVVWGRIAQANNTLFYPGLNDAPADIVFCPNPQIQIDPEALGQVARQFFSLKNTQPDDPELAKVAAVITDEYSRKYGVEIPQSLSPDFPAENSVIHIVRQHLPNGYLSRSILPLLVYPEQPRIVMALPCQFWPAAMEDWWIDA